MPKQGLDITAEMSNLLIRNCITGKPSYYWNHWTIEVLLLNH